MNNSICLFIIYNGLILTLYYNQFLLYLIYIYIKMIMNPLNIIMMIKIWI